MVMAAEIRKAQQIKYLMRLAKVYPEISEKLEQEWTMQVTYRVCRILWSGRAGEILGASIFAHAEEAKAVFEEYDEAAIVLKLCETEEALWQMCCRVLLRYIGSDILPEQALRTFIVKGKEAEPWVCF